MIEGFIDLLENTTIPLLEIPLKNILFLVLVLIFGYFATILVSGYIKKAMIRAKMSRILAEFARRIVKIMLLIFVVAFAIGFLGIDAFAGILSLSVVSGFVLGFALQDTLGNLAAGFMIAITKPFKKGDYVEIAGDAGSIDNVGISITTMTTIDNKKVIIPNSKVYGNPMVNYTANNTRMIDMKVGISYSDDMGKAMNVAMNVLSKHEKVLKDPSPNVAIANLGDSSVDILIRPWVKTSDYWSTKWELTQQIKEAFDKNNISIPFPQRDVHLFNEK
jgi:small conductance mechanosensitive channel